MSGRSAEWADLPDVMQVVTMVVMAVMVMLDVMGVLSLIAAVDSGVFSLGKWGQCQHQGSNGDELFHFNPSSGQVLQFADAAACLKTLSVMSSLPQAMAEDMRQKRQAQA